MSRQIKAAYGNPIEWAFAKIISLICSWLTLNFLFIEYAMSERDRRIQLIHEALSSDGDGSCRFRGNEKKDRFDDKFPRAVYGE